MPQEVRIWKITNGENLKKIERTELDLEERIENWLAKDITLLSDDLIIIGRQVPTVFGGKIDLLCLERSGDVVIVELKRDKTPRDVVAQALDYASWVKDLSNENISEIANDYLKENGPLEEAFKRKFGEDPPETLNAGHQMLIVASKMDDSSERIVRYLSDSYGVGINTASFQYLKDENGNEFIARIFLIDPEQLETKSQKSSKRRQYDEVDQFMSLVKGRVSQYLAPDMLPSKSSRWAGRGSGKRYFHLWYNSKPWDSNNFCFGIDLFTDEKDSDYGTAEIFYGVNKNYLKSAGVSETISNGIQGLLKKFDGQKGFSLYVVSEEVYIAKRVPAHNLSSEEAEQIAKELAWLISNLMPEIYTIVKVYADGVKE